MAGARFLQATVQTAQFCDSRVRYGAHAQGRCVAAATRGNAGCGVGKWSGRRDSNPRPQPWQNISATFPKLSQVRLSTL